MVGSVLRRSALALILYLNGGEATTPGIGFDTTVECE
jgi:hypothetical protein